MSTSSTIRLEATHDSLRLTKRLHVDDVDVFRQFRDHAGDFERVVASDGSWSVVDQSGGGNRLTVVPPAALEPTFIATDGHVRRYTERSNDGGFIRDVTLDVVRSEPRDPENPASVLEESASGDEWSFEFSRGTIATEHVTASSHAGGRGVSFDLVLDGPQAEVVMESATRLDAVTERTVPDGDDYYVDTTGGRNEVVVTAGDAANEPGYLEPESSPGQQGGAFVLTDWRVRSPVAGGRYRVTLDTELTG